MKTRSAKNCNLKLKKWSLEERESVVKLRLENNLGPLAISKKTGIPIDQVKFWIYGVRTTKRSKKSKNHNDNSMSYYYRLKYNSWQDWKASCISSSLNKRDKLNNYTLGKISPIDLRTWIHSVELKCPYCGCELNCDNFSADHILPVSRGGKNTIDNLQQICKKCNNSKGSMTEDEYKSLLILISKWEDKGINLLGKLRYSGNKFGRIK